MSSGIKRNHLEKNGLHHSLA